MFNRFRVKNLFGPIAILSITVIFIPILLKLQANIENAFFISVVFYSLISYWLAALIFNIRGFFKSRIPTPTKD